VNLGEIRVAIADALKFAPESSAYATLLSRHINDVYLELIGQNQWRFRQRTFQFPARADIPLTTAGWLNGSDVVVNVAPTPAENWRHAQVAGPDGALHSIQRISGTIIYLKDVYAGATVTGPGTVFWWRYPMDRRLLGDPDYSGIGLARRNPDLEPPELWPMSEVLGIVERNDGITGPFLDWERGVGDVRALTLAEEQGWNLNIQDSPGEPRFAVVHPRSRMPPTGVGALLTATAIAGGSLPAATAFRYFYTFRDGRDRSDRSEIVTATTTVANKTIQLGGLPASAVLSGFVKEIWREQAGTGVFRWLDEVPAIDLTYPDDGLPLGVVGERWEDQSPLVEIEVWPRPEKNRLIEVRYLAGNRSLLLDNDVPDMPAEYHRLLVHRVVQARAAEAEQTSLVRMHRELGDEMEDRMKRRYLLQKGNRPMRKPWAMGETRPPWRPLITFTG
jgi:hypothetical protein